MLRVFAESDKNGKQIRLHKLLRDKYVGTEFFPKKHERRVCHRLAPLARILVTSAAEFKLEWNSEVATSLHIDRILAATALAVDDKTAPAIKWG